MTAREYGIDDALSELQADLAPLTELEEVEVGHAAHRILARDLVSPIDLPTFDGAAMDGYALRASDGTPTARLNIVGRALAGHAFGGTVDARQAVRILTGAPLPAGADAIAIDEEVSVEGSELRLARSVTAGANVRRRGEHVRQGDVILPRGRRLRASDIGLAASIGSARLHLVRRLRVGLLSTGDELTDAPVPLSASAAYDGNRPFLTALLRRSGYEVSDLGIAADTADALAASLARAAQQSVDIILTTGGAAQGDADFVRRHGNVRFIAVDFRPGRGVAVGSVRVEQRVFPLLGLPGNAVAAYVMYQLLVRPLLGWLAGAGLERPLTLQLPLGVAARVRPGRIEWRRARWRYVDSRVEVEPLIHQGSAMLRTVSEADALVAIGPLEHTEAGALVPVIPLEAID